MLFRSLDAPAFADLGLGDGGVATISGRTHFTDDDDVVTPGGVRVVCRTAGVRLLVDDAAHALGAQRHMDLYGTTQEHLAEIAIGVVPILLGISMWLQFRMNPAPMDETQKQVFALMPWVLMFVMAPFAVGLQVYWITSNLLTIAQQRYLYARHPQLKAQADKDQQNIDRSVAREKKATPPAAPNKPKRR